MVDRTAATPVSGTGAPHTCCSTHSSPAHPAWLLTVCAGNASHSAGRAPLSGDAASGGAVGAVAGRQAAGPEGISSLATGPSSAAGARHRGMVKSASYSALDGAVTSSLAAEPATDPAAAAAAPVPLNFLPPSRGSGMQGELYGSGGLAGGAAGQQQELGGMPGAGGSSTGSGKRTMTRVQSVPQLCAYGGSAGSPVLPMQDSSSGMMGAMPSSHVATHGGQQWMAGSVPQHGTQQQQPAAAYAPVKAENAFWSSELSYHQVGACTRSGFGARVRVQGWGIAQHDVEQGRSEASPCEGATAAGGSHCAGVPKVCVLMLPAGKQGKTG